MARKKTAADEAYNVRRRARRQAARLEKEAASLTGRRREVAQRRAASLREQIEKTYARKGGSRAAREEAFSKLAREVTQRAAAGKRLGGKNRLQQAARNRAFAEQLANALNYDTITGKGIPSSLARDPEMARSMALVFMHAHTDIRREQYDLHTPQNIYKAIMKAHGTSDLQQAFLQTMRENKPALQDMFRAMKDEADGGEQKYEAVRPYLSMVHQQPRYRA